MHVEESKENYLETILLLKRKKAYVRSVDVAEAMGFSKPSISRAMGILKEAGYVTIEPDGNIQLTESGRQRAESVYERHRRAGRLQDRAHHQPGSVCRHQGRPAQVGAD